MVDKVLETLSSKQFAKHGSGVTVTIANPLKHSYHGLPPAGTTLTGPTGDDVVLSIQEDGEPQTRSAGTSGAFELADVDTKNGVIVFHGFGERNFELLYR